MPRKLVTKQNSFALNYPELVKEYSTSNDRSAEELTYGSKYRASWTCSSCSHSWEAPLKNRTLSGTGCPAPICLSKKLIASNELQGLKRGSLAHRYPSIALLYDAERNAITAEEVSPFSHKSYRWLCGEGHSYAKRVHEMVKAPGCPVCRGTKLVKGVNDFKSLYPEEYSEALSPLVLDEETIHSRKELLWQCKICRGVWKEAINTRKRKTSKGCPQCHAAMLKNRNLEQNLALLGSVGEHELLSKEWSLKNDYNPHQIPLNSKKRVLWDCSNCKNSWSAQVYLRGGNREQGCPRCSKSTSKLENKFDAFLQEHYTGPIYRWRKPLSNEGKRLELDFWLPDINLAFEVQDTTTHAHQENVPLVGLFYELALRNQGDLYKKGPSYHELKRELAWDQLGVTLVDIWEESIVDRSFEALTIELLEKHS